MYYSLPAGGLVFSPARHAPSKPGSVTVCEDPTGYGSCQEMAVEDVRTNPTPRAEWFKDLIAYFYQRHDTNFPHLEFGNSDAEMNRALDAVASGAGLSPLPMTGYVRVPDNSSAHWCRGFVSRTQAGALDGTGVLLIYTGGLQKIPRTARFKICDHDPVAGTSANPRRGYHPARCGKCGLDMTVDSGD